MITGKQIGLLHVAKAQLGLDDAEYRELLRRFGQVESSRKLSQLAFDAILGELRRRGFRKTGRPGLGWRWDMASDAQIALIRHLWAEYTGHPPDAEARLGKWLERYFHVSALRFLPAGAAPKAIVALKRMVERAARPPESPQEAPVPPGATQPRSGGL